MSDLRQRGTSGKDDRMHPTGDSGTTSSNSNRRGGSGNPAANNLSGLDGNGVQLAVPIYDPPPRLEPYQRLTIALLGLTVLIGTGHSLLSSSSSAAITSFRGRMPSPPDVIAFTKSSIPTGPLSSLNLGELNPNYFANKRNIFNVIFVKRAWGWTTLCFLVHWTSGLVTEYLASPTTIPSRTALNGVAGIEKDALDARERDTSNVRRKAVIWRPLARYILATTYWLLFTTWFFGPSLSDRLLIWSGAVCVPTSVSSSDTVLQGGGKIDLARQSLNDPNHVVVEHSHCFSTAAEVVELRESTEEATTAAAAASTSGSDTEFDYTTGSDPDLEKGASSASGLSPSEERKKGYKKAYWRGGHDISGHSFLLTLSTLFLMTEIGPTLSVLAKGSASSSGSGSAGRGGRSASGPPGVIPIVPRGNRTAVESGVVRRWSAIVTLSLCGIWWWMLLMTSLYFHTPQEKMSGFVVGLGAWWGSYVLAG